MSYDGSLVFDTKVNKEGFEKGINQLKSSGEKAFGVVKKSALALSASIGAIGAASLKIGIDFEKAMSEVQAVTGATGAELKLLEQAARDAGATTDKSAKDAAEALLYMGLAGWDVTDSQKALLPILKLSSAANMDLGRTSDLVTDTMSVLNLEIQDLGGYLDILAQTSRNSNTNVDQLGEAFLNVGGKMTQLGMGVEEGAVALGLLADNGIKGSEAGRGLNAILTNLTVPTGRAKDALKELGISAFDSSGEFIGLEETLLLLEKSMDGMTQEQQNMYLSMIAGKEHSKTLNALMGELGEGFDSLSGHVANADGVLEDMYNVSTDNLKGAINELTSALEELALKIFDVLTPIISSMVEVVQNVVDWLNSFSEETQEIIVQVALLVATIGPAIFIVEKLVSGFMSAITVFTEIGALLGPHGLIILGIAAVALAVTHLWKTNEEFRDKIGEIWEQVKEVFSKTLELIQGLIEKFIESVNKFWNQFGDTILEVMDIAWKHITGIIESALDIITGVLDVFVGLVTGDWGRFADGIEKTWEGMWKAIRTVLESAWSLLSLAFTSLYDSISKWFTDLVKDAKDWGKDIITWLGDGIISMLNFIGTKAKEIGDKVKDSIHHVFKNATQWGKDMVTKLSSGISGMAGNLGNTASNLAKDTLNKIKSGFSGAFNIGQDLVKGLWNGINNVKGWLLGKISGFTDSVMGGIKGFFGIKSPSTKMRDEVGKNLALGIGVGFDDEYSNIANKMKNAVNNERNSLSEKLGSSSTSNITNNNSESKNETNINVNVKVDKDTPVSKGKDVGREIGKEFNRTVRGRGVVIL